MKLAIAAVLLVACVPSQSAVFGPVDREVNRRIGVDVEWRTDGRVPAAVSALLAKPLDRDAAVRIALAMNKRLQAQYDELGIAASEVAAATVLAPLEVDVEYKRSFEGDGTELELDATQDMLDLIQIPQRRGIAQSALAAARARAVSVTVSLVARVEAAYIDIVAAQQELELRQTAFDAASASADVVERMAAAGNVPELRLARELDQREQARIELGRAQAEVELRREALNDLLGVSGKDTHWTIAGRLPDLPGAAPALDSLEHDAIAASLDLEALRADETAAAGRVGVARLRSWLPKLGVGVSANRYDDEWEVGPAISIGIPLFNQQQGPRARANAEMRRARNEASATATSLRATARATRQRVLEAHAEARHLRDVVLPLRQRILDETLKQYNAMNATTFELLSARRELVDAGRQHIDALRRFWRAAADARALARGGMVTGEEVRASTTRSTAEGHSP